MEPVRKNVGTLEIVVRSRKIEILVEKQGDRYKYIQKLNDEKRRSLGIYSQEPMNFSNLIEGEYNSRGIDVESKKYFPNSYSTNFKN